MHIKAYAKINLSLDITGKRSDGYHELSTVMHTINLYDTVDITPCDVGIHVTTDLPYISKGKDNIAYKAADAFFCATGIKSGVIIDIKKVIPVGGGLGGSSADGAAVLKGLNDLFGNPLSADSLSTLGSTLGADIPFCLKTGCALCEGIGEQMTPLPSLKGLYSVIIKPPVFCSTKKMYEAFDKSCAQIQHITPSMVNAINSRDTDSVCSLLSNAFEILASKMYNEIPACKDALLSLGAKGASMSGSGSCVFGLFDSFIPAENAAKALLEQGNDVYIANLL